MITNMLVCSVVCNSHSEVHNLCDEVCNLCEKVTNFSDFSQLFAIQCRSLSIISAYTADLCRDLQFYAVLICIAQL